MSHATHTHLATAKRHLAELRTFADNFRVPRSEGVKARLDVHTGQLELTVKVHEAGLCVDPAALQKLTSAARTDSELPFFFRKMYESFALEFGKTLSARAV